MRLRERFEITRPLEEMELALVRAAIADPRLVDAHEEATLRTALSLARLYKVNHEGRDVGVGAFLAPFREDLSRRLGPVLLPAKGKLTRAQLLPHLRDLKERTTNTRDQLVRRFADRLPFEAIDRELREKALVLVMGGGGGTAYVYLGVMSLLDEYGLQPKLLVGTSMGSILALFRSRMPRFEQDEVVGIVRSLSWRKLFRTLSTENRYGVPAALRLFLRSGIGRYFGVDSRGSEGPRLKDLPVKTIIAVSGIRKGKLPHPLEFYEKLISTSPRWLLNPMILPRWFSAIAEFTARPDILTRVHLGADEGTGEFDALDAAGFSSAVPGVIHYDVFRDDPRMHALLDPVHGRSRHRALHRRRPGGQRARAGGVARGAQGRDRHAQRLHPRAQRLLHEAEHPAVADAGARRRGERLAQPPLGAPVARLPAHPGPAGDRPHGGATARGGAARPHGPRLGHAGGRPGDVAAAQAGAAARLEPLPWLPASCQSPSHELDFERRVEGRPGVDGRPVDPLGVGHRARDDARAPLRAGRVRGHPRLPGEERQAGDLPPA